MGQYHKAVNLDKKQYLHPHKFTDGFKLLEWGMGFTSQALVGLLAVSNGRGGGDFADNELWGSWAGDRIAVIGDYWEEDEAKERNIPTWETIDEEEYDDISMEVLKAMCDGDSYLRQNVLESVARYSFGNDYSEIFSDEEIKQEQLKEKE